MDSFGKRLKQLRIAKNMTQEELGKVFNVTNVGVAKWESDDRFPDKNTLIKIADYFKVTLDYLLCRTDLKDSIVCETSADYDYYEFEVNKDMFPNGITKNQMIEYIKELERKNKELEKEAELSKKLKEAGFDFKHNK